MKKTLNLLFLFTAFGVFGQGQVLIANYDNTDTSFTATANGLFFLNRSGSCQPISTDFNLNFYGGTDAANLILLKSFLGSSAGGDNAAGPGTFTDLSSVPVTVPGATTSAFFLIQAWIGGPSYSSGSYVGSSGVFVNPVSTVPNMVPTLTGMPAVEISDLVRACPEPSTFALAGLAAAFLFWCRPALLPHRLRRPRTRKLRANGR
jgi:PEP-CTERM motif